MFSDPSKKLMLQDRLRQAKRKLDSSSVEHLRANKRNKTVIQVKFSKESTCKNDASHVGDSSKAFQSDNLQGADDANAAKSHSRNSPLQPASAPVVKATPHAKDVKQVDQGLFVEIFSGTAGLPAAVRKVGLHSSVGIDSSVNRMQSTGDSFGFEIGPCQDTFVADYE